MAPKWALKLPITPKVDVYSYGIVILELVRGVRLLTWVIKGVEEQEFELTRLIRIVKMKIHCKEECWMKDIMDARLNGEFNGNQAATMFEMELACMEQERNLELLNETSHQHPQMAVLKAGSRPPWVGLAAAVWVQVAAGNAYTFALYSSSLKSVLGFSQQQLTMLGVANDIGENVGILPGIACNKFPPWAVLMVGVFTSFLGYGVLWLAVSETRVKLKANIAPLWMLI
ncbi:hypothetical protein RJ640_014345 [Escallonia rubra]|uniref:Nodulin-like domain-containing protein n=1 Tax=Escallonia rubra TaxID=112253 RepID=A0AA88UEK1_9ASTE|nr:hypothetical protein RJ640_014345 [Escallonia rubra]